MTILVVGLLVFLGLHSLRIFAPGWREAQVARLGVMGWRARYSLGALSGFGLIVWGYGIARDHPVLLWEAPQWTRHLAGLLTLCAFVLLAAAHVPGNRIKARVGHPMVAGIKLWAFAHLLANGTLGAVLLFGSFLAWAVLDFASLRRRDRVVGVSYAPGTPARTMQAVLAGAVGWAVFAFLLHGLLIGVRPFG